MIKIVTVRALPRSSKKQSLLLLIEVLMLIASAKDLA